MAGSDNCGNFRRQRRSLMVATGFLLGLASLVNLRDKLRPQELMASIIVKKRQQPMTTTAGISNRFSLQDSRELINAAAVSMNVSSSRAGNDRLSIPIITKALATITTTTVATSEVSVTADKQTKPSSVSGLQENLVSSPIRRSSTASLRMQSTKRPATTASGRKRPANAGQQETGLLVKSRDFIYNGSSWDSKPFVFEEYKLLFFTVPKVGCSVWKQLFLRMSGRADWWNSSGHDPRKNGLKYLSNYSLVEANEMMRSPNWTRAVFVREPEDRFASAYLEKAVDKRKPYIFKTCCKGWNGTFLGKPVESLRSAKLPLRRCEVASKSARGFFDLTKDCPEAHWNPQWDRMPPRHWKKVNFVGTLTDAAAHARELLQRIGAWEQFGASGWGRYRNESIFSSKSNVKHATSTKAHNRVYKNAVGLLDSVRERYRIDIELYAAASQNRTPSLSSIFVLDAAARAARKGVDIARRSARQNATRGSAKGKQYRKRTADGRKNESTPRSRLEASVRGGGARSLTV